jgi:DNA recombination protein RmuC
METLLIALLAFAAATLVGFWLNRREAQRRIVAETGLVERDKRVAELSGERDAAVAARLVAETDLAATRQRLLGAEQRMAEFDKLRVEMLESTKAALLEGGTQLSSKLLEDHKRENAEAHEKAEARFKAVAQPLFEQVGKITDVVAALNGQLQDKARAIDSMQRALSSPSGAGQIAEIGLGNTLRAFGLEEGQDFQLQFSTTGDSGKEQLRPDAVVFLPPDTLIVVDCKASKFLLAIGEAENGEQEALAYGDLAATMNRHLRALASKDYQGAIQASWRASGRGAEAARVFNIMYLPSEAAVAKVVQADPDFRRKSRDLGISLAGPDTLHFAISVAAVEIRGQRQAQNHAQIVALAGQLLDSLRTVLDAAAKAGKSIESAATNFAELARSVNARLLPRARRLTRLGIEISKPLPANLPAITVHSIESDSTIEGESAEIREPELPAPPRLVR